MGELKAAEVAGTRKDNGEHMFGKRRDPGV